MTVTWVCTNDKCPRFEQPVEVHRANAPRCDSRVCGRLLERSTYCNNPLCDRYLSPVIPGHDDYECPGTITNSRGKRFPCGCAVLTEEAWERASETASIHLLEDYHAGDAPQSVYDNAARRKR